MTRAAAATATSDLIENETFDNIMRWR